MMQSHISFVYYKNYTAVYTHQVLRHSLIQYVQSGVLHSTVARHFFFVFFSLSMGHALRVRQSQDKHARQVVGGDTAYEGHLSGVGFHFVQRSREYSGFLSGEHDCGSKQKQN